jgi:predicted nuclease of predicted toxin-antitoxin system
MTWSEPPGLRYLADMNISPRTVEALRQRGLDIVRVSSLLPADAPDSEILRRARQEDRVVVTQDLDFSALLALGGCRRPSLVTLRLSLADPDTVTARLQQVLPHIERALQRGSAVTVDDRVVRVRNLPIHE